MATTLLLIRHGEFDGAGTVIAGWGDGVALNARGREQMEALGSRLGNASVAAIYASPLDRTWESALILAASCGVQPQRADALGELRFGDWTGRSIDELAGAAGWMEFNTLRSFAPTPDGELLLEVQARAIATIVNWRTAHAEQVIAAVTHADVIRAILAHALGAPLDLAGRMEVAPASVSALQIGGDFVRVLYVNSTCETV